ncbi:phosphocholine-specific phospholipase C [Streptomyces sp. NPDC001292]|uniref:phosphocholine-specific phospholipase C n=1 Tax=Streptomyces sp. NPDC001292 TaxID=3364558 RepID=UPI0036AFADF3
MSHADEPTEHLPQTNPDGSLAGTTGRIPRGVPASLFRSGLSRRRLLQAAAASATAAATTGLTAAGTGKAAAAPANTAAVATGSTGTIADLKHVVILMQENRSFDHYFGMLPGVRGFGDKQALQYPDGTTVFHQPDAKRTDGGYLLPFRLETGKYNAQNAGGLPHGWTDGHNAWATGKNNGWIAAKGEQTMGYFTGEDIPWQYALASAYTVCDHNHCSIATSTSPNRIYMWSGSIDPTGANHGPAINNGGDYGYRYTWETYPEVLQKAGVSWQIYVNNDTDSNWLGDYTDNTVRSFASFNPAQPGADTSPDGLLARGNVLQTHTKPTGPNSNENVDYVLKDFIDACKPGAQRPLPEVSWIVAPYLWSEHPAGAPDYGAVYTDRVIRALHENEELWKSTLLILTFDENDGYFDHVQAPLPEPGTEGEFVQGLPIGPGARVPMTLVSPWTRGGWVSSEVFDHTSIIRFLEHWTTSLGKPAICENISDWRRTVCGDLTSAIDFSTADTSLPDLPSVDVLVAAAEHDRTLPSIAKAIPATGQQSMPVPPSGRMKARPVPYQQHATVAVDRSSGKVTATLTNEGAQGVSMQVFPDAYRDFEATPFTVTKDGAKRYVWDTATTDGKYAFSIYGPDRFVRSFAGSVVPSGRNTGAVPQVEAELVPGHRTLRLRLSSGGRDQVRFTLTANDYEGGHKTVYVDQGKPAVMEWPTDHDGYYDVVVTAADGFRYRFAGRIS